MHPIQGSQTTPLGGASGSITPSVKSWSSVLDLSRPDQDQGEKRSLKTMTNDSAVHQKRVRHSSQLADLLTTCHTQSARCSLAAIREEEPVFGDTENHEVEPVFPPSSATCRASAAFYNSTSDHEDVRALLSGATDDEDHVPPSPAKLPSCGSPLTREWSFYTDSLLKMSSTIWTEF